MRQRTFRLLLTSLLALVCMLLLLWLLRKPVLAPTTFNAERAYQDVLTQVSFGARHPGSEGHQQMLVWLSDQLNEAGWSVEIQQAGTPEAPILNLIAHRNQGAPLIILGAHYDTREFADRDPDPEKQTSPVPGANDGASGVAVLLELARVIPSDLPVEVVLVFFDAEDQGQIKQQNWIQGSTVFADSLIDMPQAVVIVDMVGDSTLRLPLERNSSPKLQQTLWKIAQELGYETIFVNEPGPSILDDHIPFIQRGIPAVDIIDFGYAFWHTTQDTPDKVSPQSLKAVGDTLLEWLVKYHGRIHEE
ncbi:M28 family peptidase [Anaerolinea thermophila]|uniref:Peptidase M28 family protein n=1 Tax=Anaerolinea thermophila (strain DSM 14523 / JCM 11388 / NBRC 100420 / UNI-1) TaxID=926569 RepID=E8N5K5_ANATU|nr:M28 family peptidase [Anaerolinea thermophila]BAJ63719.1 peptidase M28 family protein [Anaerolinea thermophila UNI-1]